MALESKRRALTGDDPPRRARSLLAGALIRLREWAPYLFDAAGVLALLMGGYLMLQTTHRRLDCYDEGVVLSHSRMVAWGYWPYRDFFTQYPPGIFVLLVTLWKLFGTKILVARYLGHALRLAVSLLAGVVCGRTVGRRFTMLPAGLLLMFLARLTPSPAAWYAGLMFALASIVALSHAAETRLRGPWMVAGTMLGLTLSFRHDLFMYFVTAMSPGVFYWVRHRALSRQQALRLLGWTAAGAAIPFALFWVPTLVMAKWSTILHDGFLDQVRYVMPGRRLPLPSLSALVVQGPLTKMRLPAGLTDWPCMVFLIVLAAPALGLLQTLRARRPRVDRVSAGLLTALSVAVLPQATGRADFVHGVYGLAPGLILVCTFAMSFGRQLTWRGGISGVLVLAFFAWAARGTYPPRGPLFTQVGDWQLNGSPSALGIPDDQATARRELRAFVQSHSAAREQIFIGSVTHAQVMVNEVDLYFVLDRPAATRYLQFDPGTVTRAEVQAQMIRTLDEKRTHMVVLARPPFAVEPNDSAKMGATILDEYLQSRYKAAAKIGPYEVRFRQD